MLKQTLLYTGKAKSVYETDSVRSPHPSLP